MVVVVWKTIVCRDVDCGICSGGIQPVRANRFLEFYEFGEPVVKMRPNTFYGPKM